MSQLPGELELLHGRAEPPAAPRELRAGPVTVELHGIDLRYLRANGVELVRRVYVAVRDEDWETPPPQVSELEVEASERSFRVTFTARHESGDLAYSWRGEIEGGEDGAITYTMDGEAERAFRYCRAGLNLLHPPADCAGAAYRTEGGDRPGAGSFPEPIGPQRFEEGLFHPLFPPFASVEIDQRSGATVRLDFEGALFEIEDQRNWTDASFKTYSPPLALGYPFDAAPGDRMSERVRIVVATPPKQPARTRTRAEIEIEVGDEVDLALPPVGLGAASHGDPLTERELGLLRELRPAHVRADVDLTAPGLTDALERAAAEARALGCDLELAMLLGEGVAAGLERLATMELPLSRVLVFHPDEETTSAASLRSVGTALDEWLCGVPLFGGSNVHFCELNRTRPECAAIDGVAFPITPQVHAFDELSLVETLEAQPETLVSARLFCAERPICVSPVTLRPRFNDAAASDEEAEPEAGTLPFPVDSRQMSLFAAAWTVGSLRALAHADAAAITFFETTGWRGVMERESGPEEPELFRSRPGMVFPVYHVLADAGELRGARLLSAPSPAPLDAQALAVQTEGARRVALVANLAPERRIITLGGIGAATAAVRLLDAAGAEQSLLDPRGFRTGAARTDVDRGRLALTLQPYAVARVGWTEA